MKTIFFFATFCVALFSCSSADTTTENQADTTPVPTQEVPQDTPVAEKTDLLVIDEYDLGTLKADYHFIHFMVRRIEQDANAYIVMESGRNGIQITRTQAKEICKKVEQIDTERKKAVPEGAVRRIKYTPDAYFCITFEGYWYISLNGETVIRLSDSKPFMDKLQAAIAKAESL